MIKKRDTTDTALGQQPHNKVKKYLANNNNNLDAGVYYPECIHNQPAYDDVDCRGPVAESAASTVLSLPVHPELSKSDIAQVCEVM
jgi:dTDP-4-amino-4,6-dideoxygalactose transaminase